MPTPFDAFISYSHAADGKRAPALQNALRRFAKPWYRRRARHLSRLAKGAVFVAHYWVDGEAVAG